MSCAFTLGCGTDDPPAETTTGGETTGDGDETTTTTTGEDGGNTGATDDDTTTTTGGDDTGTTTGDDDTGTTTEGETTGDIEEVEDPGTTDDADTTGDPGNTTGDPGETTGDPGETTGDPGETTGGDDADAGPPKDPCVVEMGCDAAASVLLCASDSCTQYKNDCYAFCAKGNYDNLVPFADSCCDKGQDDCLIEGCDEADQGGQTVHVLAGDICTEFDNAYVACCEGGASKENGEIIPGECEEIGDCSEPCIGAPYAPVCTSSGTEFANTCEAQLCAEDESIECNAPCHDIVDCPACADSLCNPVCGVNSVTYRNSCYAACANTSIEYAFACPDCAEPQPNDVVCGTDQETYPSACIAQAQNVGVAYPGKCFEGCVPDPETDPPDGVCGNSEGAFIEFINEGCAAAANATCIYEGKCSFGTNNCADINPEYDPVCATVNDPNTGMPAERTFPNACHAGCAGAAAQAAGVCASCEAICGAAEGPSFCAPTQCVLYPNSCVPTKCIDPAFVLMDLNKNDCPAECPAL